MTPSRLEQVRSAFDAWEVDALLITSGTNRRWLSGFTGSAGILLVTSDDAFLATDSRYWEQAENQAPQFKIQQFRREKDDLQRLLERGGRKSVGIEAAYVTLSAFDEMRKAEDFTWKPLESTLEPFREVKADFEVAAIAAAAAITDQAAAMVPSFAQPGVTEREVAWQLEKFMREAGAEALAFDIIVAGGPNGALAHHRPGDRPLQAGDPIVVDMGAKVRGYCSDLTRTFVLGEPDQQFLALYETVLTAQQSALASICAGMNCQAADALARDAIEAAGYGDLFGHGQGHGVGLDIHEAPSLSVRAEAQTVKAGSVVTIEPGIYVSGWGGIRIEDLIHVEEGGTRVLSQAPKSPVIAI